MLDLMEVPTQTQPGMAGSMVINTFLFALAQGVDPDLIAAETGLTMADCARMDERFPNDLVARLWQLMRAKHPTRPLPLELARAAPSNFFGPLVYGARFAPDLRALMETFRRHQGLMSDQLESCIEGSTFWFRHPTDAMDQGAGGLVGLSCTARFLRELIRLPDVIAEVSLAGPAFGPLAAYEDFFGTPVREDQGVSALRFVPGALERSPPAQDDALFAYIQARLRVAHERIAAPDALAEVREAIRQRGERGDYTAAGLARQLGVSLRVLQRTVAEHGTTVRALLSEAREAAARELLLDRRLSVEEVALLLGYSEERAFRRAFKRQTGQTPAGFRRQAPLR